MQIAPKVVLQKFPEALRVLRRQLADVAPAYDDVRLSQIANQGSWTLTDDGQLSGHAWLLGLLVHDVDDVPDETTLVWDGRRWIEPREISEVHIDDPWSDKSKSGGAEPVPGDSTGKDQKNSMKMTMEDVRRIVRTTLEELLEVAPPGMEKVVKGLKKNKEIDNPWAVAWAIKNKKRRSKR